VSHPTGLPNADSGRAPADADLHSGLAAFTWEHRRTLVDALPLEVAGRRVEVPTYVNEFWTSRQRVAHSLHEVSYRACFKPQLPRFFIERLTAPGDTVYDPFMGRGTTLLEAALLERRPAGCDVNPLSRVLLEPRLAPPSIDDIARRLERLDLSEARDTPRDLLVFFHPETLRAICSLREYLLARERGGRLDDVDRWIRMVAVNRLTGHSSGFFSVYTLPPNQAVSVAAQRKINATREQLPPLRDARHIILRKSRTLLAGCPDAQRLEIARVGRRATLLTGSSADTPELNRGTVDLVVTSPPFLDIVNYAADNWLRCWFCGIDPASVSMTHSRRLDDWREAMAGVFAELFRVARGGGHVAFEVGEVRGGRVRLEETVIPTAMAAGFEPVLVLINAQSFTKTANVWGVTNNLKGTNTNRVVVLRRPGARPRRPGGFS
jgi:hypothetical protein